MEIDPAGNVIGRLGEGSPTLLLASHIDTVPGFIPVRHDNDRIFGRGAVDAKSSLAAMISAAYELSLRKIGGKVIIVGVVDDTQVGQQVLNLAAGIEAGGPHQMIG